MQHIYKTAFWWVLFIVVAPGSLSAATPRYDWVVAQDGSGDFRTVQEAIQAVPDNYAERSVIYIKAGRYKEKLILPVSKKNVTFIGESPTRTILTYDDYASKKDSAGNNIGTSGSASFIIEGSGFEAFHLTFENASGPVGQAVAVRIDADRIRFEDCRFLGFQDTLYPKIAGCRQYFKNCYIEGTVDFIFGWSTAYFESCEIRCKTAGYVTAASTDSITPYGFVFHKCHIDGDAPTGSFYLGRPWRDYAQTVFISCWLGKVIRAEGWHNWDKPHAEKTAYYAEYRSRGPGANAESRATWSFQLQRPDLRRFQLKKVMGDWTVRP